MPTIKIAELIPHEMNDYYFDDITGGKWDEFVKSIETSGVIEPIVITQDKTIVSGHQRVRACKVLDINEIAYEVKKYDDEAAVEKDLIETNIRQRGTIGGSDLKMGRILDKLDEIYGVKRGGDRSLHKANSQNENLVLIENLDSQNENPKTKKEILNDNGIDKSKASRAQKLSKTIPEVQELLLSGDLTTAAGVLVSELSKEEQAEFAKIFPPETLRSATTAETQRFVDQIKERDDKIKELENVAKGYELKLEAAKQGKDTQDLIKEKNKLQQQLRDEYEKSEQLKKQITELKKQEVIQPADYEQLIFERDESKDKAMAFERILKNIDSVLNSKSADTLPSPETYVYDFDQFTRICKELVQYLGYYQVHNREVLRLTNPREALKYYDLIQGIKDCLYPIEVLLEEAGVTA